MLLLLLFLPLSGDIFSIIKKTKQYLPALLTLMSNHSGGDIFFLNSVPPSLSLPPGVSVPTSTCHGHNSTLTEPTLFANLSKLLAIFAQDKAEPFVSNVFTSAHTRACECMCVCLCSACIRACMYVCVCKCVCICVCVCVCVRAHA